MAQPNMGRRKLYATRPPEDIALAFEAEVAATGLSISTLLADIVAQRYDLPLPSRRFQTKRAQLATGQDMLPSSSDAPAPPTEARPLYSTRLPFDVVRAFEAEADSLGLAYSHFLADLMAERYQLPLSSGRIQSKRDRLAHGQDTLGLGAREEVAPLVRAS